MHSKKMKKGHKPANRDADEPGELKDGKMPMRKKMMGNDKLSGGRKGYKS